MPFAQDYDFELLINEAERLVIAELERQIGDLSDTDLCLCQDCVLDMATFALNAVKPLYRVSLLGSLYAAHAMDEESYAETVRSAVHEAIERVRANPSHD
jgi:competence protein ComFB